MADFTVKVRSYDLDEARNLLEEVIDITILNLKNGIHESIVYSLEGVHGLGKTDVPKQIANDRKLGFYQVDIAQLDDLTFFTGYPTLLFSMSKAFENGDVRTKIVPEKLVSLYISNGWVSTKDVEPVLGYSKPNFVSYLEKFPDGAILYLNDYSRAVEHIYQAVMELLQNRSYGDYKLPDSTIIIGSENPDDGDNLVHTADSAQNDRIIKIPVRFSVEPWVKWAQKKGLREACINYVIRHPESILSEDLNTYVSPRRWTKFFLMLQNIKDEEFNNKESLAFMLRHGTNIIPSEIQNFLNFVQNMDYDIPSPADILLTDYPNPQILIDKLVKSINPNDNEYRSDIASMLALRLKNFLKVYAENPENKIDKNLKQRIILILGSPVFHTDSAKLILNSVSDDKRFLDIVRAPEVSSKFSSQKLVNV